MAGSPLLYTVTRQENLTWVDSSSSGAVLDAQGWLLSVYKQEFFASQKQRLMISGLQNNVNKEI